MPSDVASFIRKQEASDSRHFIRLCETPQWNLFEQLGLESLAKTSGSKGLQVYVSLNTPVDYNATKPFARRVADLAEGGRHPPSVDRQAAIRDIGSGSAYVISP